MCLLQHSVITYKSGFSPQSLVKRTGKEGAECNQKLCLLNQVWDWAVFGGWLSHGDTGFVLVLWEELLFIFIRSLSYLCINQNIWAQQISQQEFLLQLYKTLQMWTREYTGFVYLLIGRFRRQKETAEAVRTSKLIEYNGKWAVQAAADPLPGEYLSLLIFRSSWHFPQSAEVSQQSSKFLSPDPAEV